MFETIDPITHDYAAAIENGVNEFNSATSIDRCTFAVIEKTEFGLSGGVTASVSMSTLFFDHVWVDANERGKGLGSKLMRAAEAVGLGKGALQACVDTLSTQAPEFYQKLGYIELGRISGMGVEKNIDRIWFKKSLVQ